MNVYIKECKIRKNKLNYENIKSEAEKPVKYRNKIIKNAKGISKVPRRYFLLNDKLNKLWDEYNKTGVFPNPYRKRGVYYSCIQSLINLGVNKSHTFRSVKEEMKSIMQKQKNKDGYTLWDKFTNKNTNKVKAWDENTKIENTAKILQRLGGNHPYGYKLSQLHACVDLLESTDEFLPNKPNFRLNTNFSSKEDVTPVKIYKEKGLDKTS